MSQLLFTWLLSSCLTAATPAPLTVDAFFEVSWLREAQISPDGRYVAITVAKHNEKANKTPKAIYIYDIKSKKTKGLTAGASASMATWGPDAKELYYIATPDGASDSQLLAISPEGGNPRVLTNSCAALSAPLVAPDASSVAMVAELYPTCQDMACNCAKLAEKAASKSSGQVYDDLLFRFWNSWRDERRSHLVLFDMKNQQLRDLTPGSYDVPPLDLGGVQDIAFSPDGQYIAYVSNHDETVALSTNNDIFIASIKDGKVFSFPQGKGSDHSPKFSPNGEKIAYLSMERAGFEADLPRLMVYSFKTKMVTKLAASLDRPIREYVWAPDGEGLYFIAYHHGKKPLYYFSLKSGETTVIADELTYSHLSIAKDGTIAMIGEALNQPPELVVLSAGNHKEIARSEFNKAWREKVILKAPEELWFKGAKNENVQLYYLPPATAKEGQKVPLVLLIHGGPQGVFGDDFHPRWNAQMYAAKGYGVAMINFHGSIGYGQKFTDAISRHWGDIPYNDIMKGLDFILEKHSELDKDKVCASGGSYGGYMVNWLAGHTSRFACLISHAGVYNLTAKYGSTEELWFPEWEFGGNPYDNPALYKKWSPHNFAKKFKTPTLVIHGVNDFRVPLEQGLGMYTALKRRGVPARLLIFTDEDHFVQKPQNIRLWWDTIHDWLNRYLN